MGNLLCKRLLLRFRAMPSSCGLDHANDSLTTGVNVNMLDRDLLLTFSSVMIESV